MKDNMINDDKKTLLHMKKITSVTTALLILALVIFIIRYLVINSPFLDNKTPDKKASIAHIIVTDAKSQATHTRLSATGHLIYAQYTDLIAQQAGYISSITFKYGQHVKKGDLLVSIDNQTQKELMDSNRALYLKNKSTYQRQQKLNQSGPYISQNKLLTQKYTTLQSQADYLNQKAIYQQTFIKAPFNGIISDSLYTEGSYVDTNTKIATLYNPNSLVAVYQIGQQYHNQIKKGQKVSVLLANGTQQNAHISYVSPYIDIASNGFNVRATLDHPTVATTGGMSIEINQYLPTAHIHIVIPGTALLSDLEGFHVYIVKNNTAITRTVKPGQRLGDQIIILSGLKTGDRVISQGQQNVHDGATVKIIPRATNHQTLP